MNNPLVLPAVKDSVREACVDTCLSLVTDGVRDAYDKLPEHLRGLTEDELEAIHKPDFLVERLRISFWNEYELAVEEGRSMELKRILRGLCTKQTFYARVLKSEHRVAWLFTPPVDYLSTVTALIGKGQRRLWDILNAPIYDHEGRFDSRAADTIARIIESLDKRLKGDYTRNEKIDINQKSVSYNVNQNSTGPAVAQVTNLSDIQHRLRELEQKKITLREAARKTQSSGE